MKILKTILFFVIAFCFLLSGQSVSTCFASGSEREIIEIDSSNFFDEFYFNDNLYGESGRGYIVKFVEDIDFDVACELYGTYYVKHMLGVYDYFAPEKTLTACIDGNNKSILNLRLDYSSETDRENKPFASLFYSLDGIYVKNLTITNIDFNAKDSARAFCVNAKDCIFENVSIAGKLHADETCSFADSVNNCYFKNLNVAVDAVAETKCFNFAKNIIDCGFLNPYVSTTNLSGHEFVGEYDAAENWNEEVQGAYSELNNEIVGGEDSGSGENENNEPEVDPGESGGESSTEQGEEAGGSGEENSYGENENNEVGGETGEAGEESSTATGEEESSGSGESSGEEGDQTSEDNAGIDDEQGESGEDENAGAGETENSSSENHGEIENNSNSEEAVHPETAQNNGNNATLNKTSSGEDNDYKSAFSVPGYAICCVSAAFIFVKYLIILLTK